MVLVIVFFVLASSAVLSFGFAPTAATTLSFSEQTPFNDQPFVIPAVIEAEQFDNGGQGVAYNDSDAGNKSGQQYRDTDVDIDGNGRSIFGNGYVVGWTQAGEWLEYTIDVPTAGEYGVEVIAASDGVGGTLHVECDGVDKTGTISIPDTGSWDAMQTISVANVNLSAGRQVLRLVMDGNGPTGYVGDIDYLRITHRPNSTPGPSVKVYVSSRAGDRIAHKELLQFGSQQGTEVPAFEINDGVTHQTMIGFGASFLEAGMIGLNSLEPAGQESVLRALFDPENGAGFSAMKTVVAGTDFASAGGWYTYNDTPGDVEMQNFSVERDLGPNGLITYIKRAREHGNFILQAPMDYPPDWMLFDVASNQDVNPVYFDALALYYLRYLQEYQRNGIFIDYLSLFNEPGIYTKIPYTKIRDLLKNHVGPLLEREGIGTKIQLSETYYRGRVLEDYAAVLDDPEARRYVANLPYHGYDYGNFEQIAALHARHPDLPLWMSEICYAYMSDTLPEGSVSLPRYDFEDGDYWGNQIISDLEAHASAWTYWNMILDQNGGPNLVDPIHGNPLVNIQHPVVIINRDSKQVTYTGLYYYLAHFSKFVRPGAVRIETTGSYEGVRAISFRNLNGGIVTQLINSRNEDAEVQLNWQGKSVRLTVPSISITTCLWEPRTTE